MNFDPGSSWNTDHVDVSESSSDRFNQISNKRVECNGNNFLITSREKEDDDNQTMKKGEEERVKNVERGERGCGLRFIPVI